MSRSTHLARAAALARISELSARVLADPADAALAERLATARLLYDQAVTPAAFAEVSALVAETVPARPRPAPRRFRRRGRPRRAASRRFSPRTAVAVVTRPGWWRRPAMAVAGSAAVLFATATSEAGADVVAHRITVTVAGVAFCAAVVWLLARAWPVVSAYRTRRAAVAARLNEIASRVLHQDTGREQAERYILLLHAYETRPLAEVERLLDDH